MIIEYKDTILLSQNINRKENLKHVTSYFISFINEYSTSKFYLKKNITTNYLNINAFSNLVDDVPNISIAY